MYEVAKAFIILVLVTCWYTWGVPVMLTTGLWWCETIAYISLLIPAIIVSGLIYVTIYYKGRR